MNAHIFKELARQWSDRSTGLRTGFELSPGTASVNSGSIPPKTVDHMRYQAMAEIYSQCAKDIEDVIRIYYDFQHPGKKTAP